jgi:hypothetical protein
MANNDPCFDKSQMMRPVLDPLVVMMMAVRPMVLCEPCGETLSIRLAVLEGAVAGWTKMNAQRACALCLVPCALCGSDFHIRFPTRV